MVIKFDMRIVNEEEKFTRIADVVPWVRTSTMEARVEFVKVEIEHDEQRVGDTFSRERSSSLAIF